jgi:glycosyltransferase involved in cell wall biosynthesis
MFFLPFMNVPFVFEAHDYRFHHESKLISAFLRKVVVHSARRRNCRLVVTISDALRKVWEGYGVPSEKLFVAHDAVDLEMFKSLSSKSEARNTLGLDSSARIIVYAGALFEDRGIDQIMQAASRIKGAEFYLVGGAEDDLNRCKRVAEQSGLTNLHFVGQIPHRDIPTWLAAADILLMMWTWRVPTMRICSPMKMFEYMAAERLIVGPAFPTILEVLEDGKDAILFEPDNLEAMVSALSKGLAECEASEMPGRAREKVLNDHTWLERCKRLLAAATKR